MRISDWSSDVCSSDLNFQRKDHLLDVVGVVDYQRRCSVNGFAKQVKNNQASKEHQGEFSFRVALDVPTRLEDDAKDEGVHRKHEEQIGKASCRERVW